MATIGTAIKLNDMMSAPLRSITNAMNMMLSAWGDLDSSTSSGLDVDSVEEIRRELNQATSALDDMGDEQKEFNRHVDDGTNALSGMASKITGLIGAYVSLSAIKNTLSSAIEFSSDLAEVQNVVDVSFEGSAETINEWSKTTLNAFGLNELSAKQYAGTMGAMLKSSGLAGDTVTEMSMKIAELSGDMASFYNLQGDEAFEKLRSGISGETEPLKQLGINMSVANLEAYALSQGINKAYSEMSQGEQVMLRYNYLLQATADAQGDFSRTSDSFSNQQKLLGENWKAFTGEVVNGLLPALSVFFSMLNDGISWMSENWSILQPIILGVAAALGVYAVVMGICAVQSGIHAAATAVKAASEMMAAGATFAATAAQHGFNAALMACPITWIVVAIIAIIAAIYAIIAAINKLTGQTISATGVIAGVVATMFSFLWNKVAAFVNFFANVWKDPIGSIARLFADLADNVLGMLEVIASGIDKVFGSNLAESVSGWRSSLSGMITDKFGEGTEVMASVDNVDAFKAGYNWGAGVEDGVGNLFSGGFDTGAIMNELGIGSGTGGLGGSGTLGEMANGVGDIADSTAATADALDVSNENLKYVRSIAEQESINRFTTAEIRVEMGGITNTVNNTTDLDGVIDYMVTGVQEAMERVAEGVHN